MFARVNRAEDERPCAIIRVIAPVRPHGVCNMIAVITRPIWLTDE